MKIFSNTWGLTLWEKLGISQEFITFEEVIVSSQHNLYITDALILVYCLEKKITPLNLSCFVFSNLYYPKFDLKYMHIQLFSVYYTNFFF